MVQLMVKVVLVEAEAELEGMFLIHSLVMEVGEVGVPLTQMLLQMVLLVCSVL